MPLDDTSQHGDGQPEVHFALPHSLATNELMVCTFAHDWQIFFNAPECMPEGTHCYMRQRSGCMTYWLRGRAVPRTINVKENKWWRASDGDTQH